MQQASPHTLHGAGGTVGAGRAAPTGSRPESHTGSHPGSRPGWRGALLAALCLGLLLLAAGTASAGGRVALVIGNADYRLESLDLANPANDARAIAEKLGAMGFDVSLHTDLEHSAMGAALDAFSAKARGAEMAVFFFAGHGMQKDGENYLLARDFTELSLAAMSDSTLPLSRVQDALTAGKPDIGVVIIDACRNNPFAEQGIVAPGLARASGGAGLLFAYSTDPGNVAYDGDGEHSQFTEALLRHIDSPGLDVRLMFGRVRQNVLIDTGGLQIPWVEESVIGEHSFSTAPMRSTGSAVAREIERWREVSALTGAAPFEEFLAEFPDGMFREFAEQRLRQQTAGTPLGTVVGDLVTDETRPVVVASLSVLGFLPPADDMPDDPAIRRALVAYGSQVGALVVDPDRLVSEATRTLTLLGAKTAQQLRSDMAMLKAVEKASGMAEEALGSLEDLARTNPDARAVLPQARADIEAIQVRRAELLEQLDAGRSYYAELLETARSNFGTTIRAVAASMTRQVGATGGLRDRHGADIELFVRHVRQGNSTTEGSYSWLADLVPG